MNLGMLHLRAWYNQYKVDENVNMFHKIICTGRILVSIREFPYENQYELPCEFIRIASKYKKFRIMQIFQSTKELQNNWDNLDIFLDPELFSSSFVVLL